MIFVSVALAAVLATSALAQAAPRVALRSVAFDGEHALLIQPGDSAMATQASAAMLSYLRDSAHVTLVDSAAATWFVAATVRKISNLVWIFDGRLINITTGEMVLNDEYELKGDSRQMVPRGAVSFARRVVKKISS